MCIITFWILSYLIFYFFFKIFVLNYLYFLFLKFCTGSSLSHESQNCLIFGFSVYISLPLYNCLVAHLSKVTSKDTNIILCRNIKIEDKIIFSLSLCSLFFSLFGLFLFVIDFFISHLRLKFVSIFKH